MTNSPTDKNVMLALDWHSGSDNVQFSYPTGQLPTEADAVKLVEISDYIGEAAISMAARTEFEDPRS